LVRAVSLFHALDPGQQFNTVDHGLSSILYGRKNVAGLVVLIKHFMEAVALRHDYRDVPIIGEQGCSPLGTWWFIMAPAAALRTMLSVMACSASVGAPIPI
jgi:hypothetical protein